MHQANNVVHSNAIEQSNSDRLQGLIQLFMLEKKKEVIKHCKELVIHSDDFVSIILAGRAGVLGGYKYQPHFIETRPEHLEPTDADLQALADNGVGKIKEGAQKTLNKMSQIFKERRLLCCHLFYTEDHKYWNLFYFDQRDTDRHKNHWKVGGPHIHYSRESFTNLPLSEVWSNLQSPKPDLPTAVHIRYQERDISKVS